LERTLTYASLPSGLRIVHRRCPGLTEYCGVAVDAGSRDESSPDRYGLAHYVEHTIFKGTKRHRSQYIINRMEAVGGELNAYTTKEETMVYAAMPVGNVGRALSLIADLVTDSVFPESELVREREVIVDEINSYLDSPSDGVFDLFDEMAYAGNPLAHNILGTEDSVMAFTSDDCRRWLAQNYCADNMVVFYAGPASADKVFRMVGRYFSHLPVKSVARERMAPSDPGPGVKIVDAGNHQAHTVLGIQVPGMRSPQRYALALTTNILGGPGMNSLLNVALRERRGLVYTVEASTALLTDTGLWTVYFGCDMCDIRKCVALAGRVIGGLAESRLSPRRIEAAKRQYVGQLALGSENKEQVALAIARATLYFGHALEPQEVAERIMSVSADEVRGAAALVLPAVERRLTLN